MNAGIDERVWARSPRGLLRMSAGLVSALVLAGGLLTYRQVVDGNQHMRLSDAAFDSNALPDATLHARRAASAYAPGARHVSRAYDRLEAIAVGAEAAGRPKDAAQAWRAVRSAALETRHLWVIEGERLRKANENLARLGVSAEDLPPDDRRAASAKMRAELERDESPSPHWLLALAAGFFASLGGLSYFAMRGVSRDGAVLPRKARWGGVVTLLGVVVWVVAAWQA